ncbi:MAG: glycoside hydrolase family 20 zincin-like fold domain-containing protein, partial [Opitutaceae bacterium]
MRLSRSVATTLLAVAAGPLRAAPPPFDVMPAPEQAERLPGRLALTPGFSFAASGWSDARLHGGLARLAAAWRARTGLALSVRAGSAISARFTVECRGPGPAVPSLGEDESYTLRVTPRGAVLRAAEDAGVLRG